MPGHQGACSVFVSSCKPCVALFGTLNHADMSPSQEAMPFAVVGSDKEYQVNGKRVLGRKTQWGIVEGG